MNHHEPVLDEPDDEVTNDVYSGACPASPLTEFRFGTSRMTLRTCELEVNLNWFRAEDDDA